MISVEELYAQAQIVPTGSARWGDDVPSTLSGVYVISTECVATITSLPDNERAFWVPDQVIIYIGRAKQLKRRLRQFRRHVYGRTSPHRGGQAILLLDCAKKITWAEVEDYGVAEAALIEAFCAQVGQRPFGNRVRSAKLVIKSTHKKRWGLRIIRGPVYLGGGRGLYSEDFEIGPGRRFETVGRPNIGPVRVPETFSILISRRRALNQVA